MGLSASAVTRRRLVPEGARSRDFGTSLLFSAGLGLLALFIAVGPLPRVALVLAGATLGVAVLVAPLVGLVALTVAIPFAALFPLPALGANLADLLLLLLVVAWIGRGLAARRIVFTPPPATWPLLVFLWAGALSLTQATSWREGVPEWAKWVEFALLYLVASQVLSRRQVWWVLAALFVAGTLQVLLGTYQFLSVTGPEAFVLRGRFMRAYGTFRQPNPYAGYLGYLAPVALSLALGGLWQALTSRRAGFLWQGLICGGATMVLAAGIGMSGSRGSWLALGAAALIVVGFRSRRTAVITTIALCGLWLAIMVWGSPLAARVSDLGGDLAGADPARTEITDANFSVLERLAHWQAGLRMFENHPWLGVGIGNFAVAYAAYALPHWYEPLGHAHNVFINFLAETGIAGAGAFVVFWAVLAASAVRAAGRNGGDPNRRALAVGLLGTLVYLTVHSMFDNLFVQHMQLQLALLAAMVAALGTRRAPSARPVAMDAGPTTR